MKKTKGAKLIESNLNKELKSIKGVGLDGLLEGSYIVLREAKLRVPYEIGDLFRSGYARKAQDGRMATEVGFSSVYAAAIHEKTEMKWAGIPRKSGKGVYWGPKGEPKYLSNAIRHKRAEFLEAVKRRANDRPRKAK